MTEKELIKELIGVLIHKVAKLWLFLSLLFLIFCIIISKTIVCVDCVKDEVEKSIKNNEYNLDTKHAIEEKYQVTGNFCHKCGKDNVGYILYERCSECDKPITYKDDYCSKCGTKIEKIFDYVTLKEKGYTYTQYNFWTFDFCLINAAIPLIILVITPSGSDIKGRKAREYSEG